MRPSLTATLVSTAARARRLLDPAATADITAFVLDQRLPSGAFHGRSAAPDLYYTAFGYACLRALDWAGPWRNAIAYLGTFGDGRDLDLVHLSALAQTWGTAADTAGLPRPPRQLAQQVALYRQIDGGFAAARDAARTTVYASYLAVLALDALETTLPDTERLLAALEPLRARDGGYANEPESPHGGTAATAAAAVLQTHLTGTPPTALGQWLTARMTAFGGFAAHPATPVPDLLSTAVALFALALMQYPLPAAIGDCLDFVTALWHENGGFSGHPGDRVADPEYTFYALLALGSLAGRAR